MIATATQSVYDIKINSLQGQPIDLQQFKGTKMLFVNVASKCGFTSQYKDLQHLQDTYKDTLIIIGVPCNQFGKQEPGTPNEIQEFCEINYGVTFLITEKIAVKGENQHPLYAWLTKKSLNGKQNSTVKWNFQKYLIDDDGEFLNYYYSITSPTSTRLIRYLK
ncbi:glutathione peroxidase [Winogradskyella psychrotolerans]|uniref:glutathione peroxidase n=1 Tax=Winogradskyella psychrotolerans TaxID=1344585 RepID=UPI001C072960|nr:glutathione peroxidase [Winogradskyella psychrotolerans]MBU2920664.1 glutathione peroxidase [Winogradskyella psychrotolerans]